MNPALTKWGLDTTKLPPTLAASREPIVRFFSYHDAHPVALMLVLMEKFGVDWFDWEAETLKQEILSTFKATSISEHNWQKIQAVRTLTQTVGFWSEWHIFEKIIQSLNNNVPRFDIAQRCTLAQLMAGVDIANQIREEQYDEEVQRYIAACALDEGVVFLPPPLDFAQRVLSAPSYRCRVCGNVEYQNRDGEETHCEFCTGEFQDEHPLNFKPNPKLPDGLGKNLDLFLERDPSSVEKRFNEVKDRDPRSVNWSDTSPEDVQSLKLVVAYEYMKERQRQLIDQLEELKSWVTA
jgi:hypothetical protein